MCLYRLIQSLEMVSTELSSNFNDCIHLAVSKKLFGIIPPICLDVKKKIHPKLKINTVKICNQSLYCLRGRPQSLVTAFTRFARKKIV